MELAKPDTDMEKAVPLAVSYPSSPPIRLLDCPSIFSFFLAHISTEHVASLSPRLKIVKEFEPAAVLKQQK